ncbi:MAG TPA: hypothetical protein VNZ52_07505 [Candidatus Thermoplasmatota archaeon]|nr:hypothetical protein [Candidatus Thermoplasmatota archaeon]
MASTRAVSFVVAVVVALAVLAPAALAQGDGTQRCRAPLLTVPEPPGPFEPGNARPFTVMVANPNPVPGQVKLTVPQDAMPPGWSAIVGESARAVSPGGEASFTVTVAAPARGVGQEAGDVKLTASMACQTEPIATQSIPTTHTLHVELAVFGLAWVLWGLGLAAAVAGAIVLMVVRGRRRSVHLRCEAGTKPVPPGDAASFPLLVENHTPERLKAHLTVRVHGAGWSAFLAVDEVDLDAGEAVELWASLRAPAEAAAGAEGRATVTAARVDRPRDRATVTLKGRVAPAAETPAAPAAQI